MFASGLLLLLVVIFLFLQPKSSVTTPRIIPEQNTSQKFEFNLINTSPPSGQRATVDASEYLNFTFSLPVDPKSVVIQVVPYIKLKAYAFDTQKNILVIKPDYDIWKPNVQYQIILTNITAETGQKYDQTINYTYINTPPKTVYSGDSH